MGFDVKEKEGGRVGLRYRFPCEGMDGVAAGLTLGVSFQKGGRDVPAASVGKARGKALWDCFVVQFDRQRIVTVELNPVCAKAYCRKYGFDSISFAFWSWFTEDGAVQEVGRDAFEAFVRERMDGFDTYANNRSQDPVSSFLY